MWHEDRILIQTKKRQALKVLMYIEDTGKSGGTQDGGRYKRQWQKGRTRQSDRTVMCSKVICYVICATDGTVTAWVNRSKNYLGILFHAFLGCLGHFLAPYRFIGHFWVLFRISSTIKNF